MGGAAMTTTEALSGNHDNELNIALAELMPDVAWLDDDHYRWMNGDEDRPFTPTTDLNAVHEAEKTLSIFQQRKYADLLQDTVRMHCVGYVLSYDHQLESLFRIAHATARQRTVAPLIVLRPGMIDG